MTVDKGILFGNLLRKVGFRSSTQPTGYGRFKLYDVSQLPVVQGERILGLIDESDVLLAVYNQEERFREPVSTS